MGNPLKLTETNLFLIKTNNYCVFSNLELNFLEYLDNFFSFPFFFLDSVILCRAIILFLPIRGNEMSLNIIFSLFKILDKSFDGFCGVSQITSDENPSKMFSNNS